MSMMASWANGLSKSYLYTSLARDAVRFLRKNLSDVDFDRDEWLHRAGLSSYRPGNSVFLFVAGALAGAGVALAMAPKAGSKLRSELKNRAMTFFDHAEEKVDEKKTELRHART